MPAVEAVTTLALAGWGTDGRIFSALAPAFGAFITPDFPPDGGCLELAGIISSRGAGKVRLIGWSLGALAVAELALARPDLVAEAILVSARPAYPPSDIETARIGIRKNRRGYLASFFSGCFGPDEAGSARKFRKEILPGYLDGGWDLPALERGLDRLASGRLDPALRQAGNVRFVHGTADRIAPFAEITGFTAGIPADRLVFMEGRGHIPFLDPEFSRILSA